MVIFFQVNAQTTVQMIFLDASYVLRETLGCDMEQLQNGTRLSAHILSANILLFYLIQDLASN